MELKEVLVFYKKLLWQVSVGSLLFLLVGVGVYFLPAKYVASGSYVVVRNVEPLKDVFSYEGHYAQLTAQDFSSTLVTFFKNESILASVSESTTIGQRELRRKIRVIKEGPNVVRLEVKHRSPEVAKTIWDALRKNVFDLVAKINQEADPGLKVFVVGEGPLLKEAYKNVYVYGFAGLLMGFLVTSFYFALREYLK